MNSASLLIFKKVYTYLAVPGFSCGMQVLCWVTIFSSSDAGLSCPEACGVFIPWPEIEPVPPALEGDSSSLDHQRSPSLFAFVLPSFTYPFIYVCKNYLLNTNYKPGIPPA